MLGMLRSIPQGRKVRTASPQARADRGVRSRHAKSVEAVPCQPFESGPMRSRKPVIDPPAPPACAKHAAIHRAVLAIPRGRVASYGEIAARAGLPGRARLVGRVLGEAGAAVVLPWHRVLRAGGELAFPPGSAEFREQKRRLAAEGVPLRGRRVELARYGWQRDLDAELWAPPPRTRRA